MPLAFAQRINRMGGFSLLIRSFSASLSGRLRPGFAVPAGTPIWGMPAAVILLQ